MPKSRRKLKWNLHLIRCRVATSDLNFKTPKNNNATLVTGDVYWAKVLLDDRTNLETYNWDWVSFDKGALKRVLKKEKPGDGL